MKSWSVSNVDALIYYISNVRDFGTKAKWLFEIAQTTQNDKNIPLTTKGLVAFGGIIRK